MSQLLLFLIGTAVFAVTLCASLYYGYLLFNRAYQADQPLVTAPGDVSMGIPVPALVA
jgi:hypothetical protein